MTATVADGYYGAGVLGHLAGENEAAAADAEVALGLYREIGDAAGMGAVMSLNGMICLYAGQIDEAVRWYETGLEVATWEAAPRSHATLLSNFAPLRARQGDLAEASRLAEEAAIRYRLLADRRSVAAQLGNLAGWSAQLGDVERARDLINESRQIFEELADPSNLREVYLQLTEHALNEGDLRAADEVLALADQYGAELEDPWGDSLAASFAAELLLLRGDLAAAVRDAKVAAARAEQITWQHAAIRAYFVQAVGLARLGRASEGLRAARSGLKLCTAEDAAAITSLSSVVSVLAGGPEAGLGQAAAAAAQVPGAAPYAAVGSLGRAAGTGPVEPADLMSVRQLAIDLCGPA